MKKSQILVLILVAALGGGLTFALYRQGEARMRESAAALAAQREQLARVESEQKQLAARVAATGSSASNQPVDASPEIARLRAQAEALRKRVEEVGRQTNAAAASNATGVGQAAKSASKREAPKTPEYYEKLHKLAGARTRDAMAMVAAVRLYAEEHDGKMPTDADQLAPYVPKTGLPVSGTNSFDVVYKGSLDALGKIPSSSLAVLRSKDIWVAPSGKPARVYGLYNGASQIVESDDDFKSWEAEHVVSTGGAGAH